MPGLHPVTPAGLCVLSAPTEPELQALVAQTVEQLARRPAACPDDLAAAAARKHHACRLAAVCHSSSELRSLLEGYLGGLAHPNLRAGRCEPGRPPKMAWIFSGNLASWDGMGRDLFESEHAFRDVFTACDEAWRAQGVFAVGETMTSPGPRAPESSFAAIAPANLSLQLALASQWRAWGIQPDAVVGLSLGEISAACAAGAYPLVDVVAAGAPVIATLGRLPQRAAATAVLELSRPEVEALLERHGGKASLILVNHPRSMVIAGEQAVVEEILGDARRRHPGSTAQVSQEMDVVIHTPALDAVRDDILAASRPLVPRAPVVPLYSGGWGRRVEASDLGPAHLWRSIREPVDFHGLFQELLAQGFEVFLEINSHPTQLYAVLRALHDLGRPGMALPSLQRGKSGRLVMLRSLAALYTAGFDPSFGAVPSLRESEGHAPEPPARTMTSEPIAPAVQALGEPARSRTQMEDYIVRQVADVLGCSVGAVDPAASLSELGVDSMKALEVMARAELDLDLSIDVEEFLKAGSLAEIARRLEDRKAAQGEPLSPDGSDVPEGWEEGDL